MPFDEDMSGVLFPNAKAKSEKSPQWTGNVVVNGTRFQLAAWERTSKKTGDPFLSIKVSEDTRG